MTERAAVFLTSAAMPDVMMNAEAGGWGRSGYFSVVCCSLDPQSTS